MSKDSVSWECSGVTPALENAKKGEKTTKGKPTKLSWLQNISSRPFLGQQQRNKNSVCRFIYYCDSALIFFGVT